MMEDKEILEKILNNKIKELNAEEINKMYNKGMIDKNRSLTRKGIDYLGLDFENEG